MFISSRVHSCLYASCTQLRSICILILITHSHKTCQNHYHHLVHVHVHIHVHLLTESTTKFPVFPNAKLVRTFIVCSFSAITILTQSLMLIIPTTTPVSSDTNGKYRISFLITMTMHSLSERSGSTVMILFRTNLLDSDSRRGTIQRATF